MSKASAILDANGKPYRHAQPAAPRDLAEMAHRRPLRATYDAARDLDDMKHHWADADAFDADAANSKAVRSKLVQRARYETWNNGYADGIAQTYATDLVGIGPQLRMQTGSTGFNQMVEREWWAWCKAINLPRKLRCSAHAKHVDGEGIGVIRRNPSVRHRVKIDWCLYEAEQCQTPFLSYNQPGRIDGIEFDRFGTPIAYEFLKYHPGGQNGLNYTLETERVPANFVTHWFKLRRPGQHRGIPESTSTLNLGATARRWREATVAHAEHIAKLTVLLKSLMAPDPDDADYVSAMSTLELLTGTMVALPDTVEPVQLDAKQPTAQYAMFHKALINEQARPLSMPYNKAACDSSAYNYASGRLDHQTYHAALDVEREDCNALVLDVIFAAWFEYAVAAFGWLGGQFDAISDGALSHTWDWPKHAAVDIEAEANANKTRLTTGQVPIHRLYTDAGMDFEDEIQKTAETYGVDESVVRKRLFDIHYPPVQQGGAQPPNDEPPSDDEAAPDQSDEADVAAILKRRNGHGMLNGSH